MEKKYLKKKTVLTLSVVLLIMSQYIVFCTAQEIPSDIETKDIEISLSNANTSYENGDFKTAVHIYKTLIDKGEISGGIYFNLANSYFKEGDLAHSILNYRRAQSLTPRDIELIENLEYARALTADEFSQTDRLNLYHYYDKLRSQLSIIELSLITSISYFVLAILFSVIIYSEHPFRIHLKKACLGLLIIALAAGATLSQTLYERSATPEAIVMNDRLEIRSGPGNDFSTSFILHAGAEIKILRTRDNWAKILFPTAGSGWAEIEYLEKI